MNQVANLYKLPNCFTVLEEAPWSKQSWKETVKTTMQEYQENMWNSQLENLPSLEAINPGAIKLGIPHPVWETASTSVNAVKQAISKVRFLTNTLMTGKKISKFFGNKSNCNCGFPVESRAHILLDCTTYTDLRIFRIEKMIETILLHHPWIITEQMIMKRQTLLLLLLDPSWFRKDIGSPTKGLPNIMEKSTTDDLERMGRTLCYQIYRRRFSILNENNDDSETDTDEEAYSLHDTSEDDNSDESDDNN